MRERFCYMPLWLRSLFWREQTDRELDEELRDFLNRATQRNLDDGMTATEAGRAAALALGGLEQIKEECRDVRGLRLLEELIQDVRYGLRMIRKAPAFACVAVAMLALAIGANATAFSLVYALLVRPLPYPESHELVLLWERFTSQRLQGVLFSLPEFSELEAKVKCFEDVAVFGHAKFILSGHGDPERVEGSNVSASLFSVLRVDPIAGRVFRANEQDSVVISERLWQRRFDRDPAIIGGQLSLNGRPYTVVGIMSAWFRYPLPLFNIRGQFAGSADIWRPINFIPGEMGPRAYRTYGVVARLRPGVTTRQANIELETLGADWARRYSDDYSGKGFGIGAYELRDQITGRMRAALFVLQGAALLLLIIAGANLAAMVLARAGVRAHEMAIRIALGAGPPRLVRQSVTESMALSIIAGGAGLLLCWLALFLLRSLGPQTIPRLNEVNLDKIVVVFVLVLSMIISGFCGLIPVAKGPWRSSVVAALKEGGRGATQAKRRMRLRNIFLVTETALAIVLLIGAGSLGKSFIRLRNIDPGFRSENILTMELSLPSANYPTEKAMVDFLAQTTQKIASLPKIAPAAFTSILPLSGSNRDASFAIEGVRSVPSPDEEIRMITPDYFRVLEIPLHAGRFFNSLDTSDAEPVVIINQALSERYWPAGDSLGKRISLNDPNDGPRWMTIVGVVANIKHRGLDERVRPELYLPYTQRPYPLMTLVVRSALPQHEVASAIRHELLLIDPSQPIANVRSLDRVVADSIASRRMTVLLVGTFAVIAALFTSIGVYGVMVSIVLERRKEMALRMALGARSLHILLRSTVPSLGPLLLGAIIGVVTALSLNSLRLLRDTAVFDMSIVFGALASLLFACCLPMYLAARRATQEDLITTLREN